MMHFERMVIINPNFYYAFKMQMFINGRTRFKYFNDAKKLLFKRNCIKDGLQDFFHGVKLDNYYLICPMKNKILSFLFLFSIIISSCNTSNNVVSSGFIQKRKYTKGYHFDLTSKKAVSRQPLAISQKQSSTKIIKTVESKISKVLTKSVEANSYQPIASRS